MKPLPAQDSMQPRQPAPSEIPLLPEPSNPAAASPTEDDHRISACMVQRAYPWLLFTSTAIAGIFCLLYITKPVILGSQAQPPFSLGNTISPKSSSTASPLASAVETRPSLMPSADHLPGEKSAARPDPVSTHEAAPPSQPVTAFEQTNLRVQHILNAQAPGGLLAKIDLDVPVLYQSRHLRWTAAEVAEARELVLRLKDYQEKSRALRSEGTDLLAAWNRVIEKAIPTGALRADSPALPANQQDTADSPRPAGLNTTELIKIQPTRK